MTRIYVWITVLIFTHIAAAQIMPPSQSLAGPGGSDYPFSEVKRYGPYRAAAVAYSASQFFVYQPAAPKMSSLPVILFLHGHLTQIEGYPAGDAPGNYYYWIAHLVRKGYTVVYPYYDEGVPASATTATILTIWQSALNVIAATLIPPSADQNGIESVFVGHSIGAVWAFAVAQQLATDPISGVPAPRAIVAAAPGIGEFRPNLDFSQLSPGTFVELIEGDEDVTDLGTAASIWASLTLPLAQRDFVEVISDTHGSPEQLGNHWFPLTNGLNDTAAVDNRDFNVTWKLSAGLSNCVLNGTDCSYVLGGPDESYMGLWSDGTPVKQLEEQ